MRILQICNKITYPPNEGGSAAVLSISLPLASAGHEVTIMSIISDKHYPDEKYRAGLEKDVRLNLVKINSTFNIWHIVRNFFFSGIPFTAERYISPIFENELAKLLQRDTFDVVQLEGLYLLPYIDSIRKYSKALISFRSHNAEHEIWKNMAQYTTDPLKRIYFMSLSGRLKKMEISFIDKYDVLIPISENDLEFYRSIGNTRPVCLCTAGYCKTDNQAFHQPASPFSLFYIGSLDWIPNRHGLLWFGEKVFKKLAHEHPNLTFNIAGRNAPARFLKKIESQNIRYFGEVSDAENFITKWAICVVPLFAGSGVRVKIIESMALGRPVVATSRAADGLGVTHGVNILIADTPEDFRNSISKLLHDRKLYDSLSEAGRLLVKTRYNAVTLAGELIEFYNRHMQ